MVSISRIGLLVCVLSSVACYAMSGGMSDSLEMRQARTALNMLAQAVAACPQPPVLDDSSDIKPIVLPLRGLIEQLAERTAREDSSRSLAACPLADRVLQDLWRDAQVKMGIAQKDQTALFVDRESESMYEEFSTTFEKTRIHPMLAASFGQPLPRGCDLDLPGYVRVHLIHEAAHQKLKNIDGVQRRTIERVCSSLTGREMLFVLFVENLNIYLLPDVVRDSALLRAAIPVLNKIDHTTRVRLVLEIFAARNVADFERFTQELSYRAEHDADALMLEKIDCAHCLHAVVRNFKKMGLDSLRASKGYASVAELEAKMRALAGKKCVWHAKHCG